MPTKHLDDLRVQAQYARQRYGLYKPKAYGQWPNSPARLIHHDPRDAEGREVSGPPARSRRPRVCGLLSAWYRRCVRSQPIAG
jgi:hypothetical protein